MDSEEISEWMAYDRIEPLFDPWVAMAIQTAATVNLFSKSKVKPADYLPYKVARGPMRPQTREEQQAPFKALAAAQAKRKAEREAKAAKAARIAREDPPPA